MCLCYSKKFMRGKFMWLYVLPSPPKKCSERTLNHKDKREAEYLRAVRRYKNPTHYTQVYCHQPLSANRSFVSPISLACLRTHLKNLRNHAFKMYFSLVLYPIPDRVVEISTYYLPGRVNISLTSSFWKIYIVFFRRNHLHVRCNMELWSIVMETMMVEKKREIWGFSECFWFFKYNSPLSKVSCAIWWTVCGNFLSLQIEFCKMWSTAKSLHSE